MTKQTAVEWLQEQLECFGNKHELTVSWTTVDELVEQAAAMEREQTIEFGKVCLDKAKDLDIRTAYSKIDQIYTETYGAQTPKILHDPRSRGHSGQ